MVPLEPRIDATGMEHMLTFQSSDIVLIYEHFKTDSTILESVLVGIPFFRLELTRLRLKWIWLKPRLPVSLYSSLLDTFVTGLRRLASAGQLSPSV